MGPSTMKGMVSRTINIKCWVLGPSGLDSSRSEVLEIRVWASDLMANTGLHGKSGSVCFVVACVHIQVII